MKKHLLALLAALVLLPTPVASADEIDPPDVCDVTVDRPYERRTSQGYVQVQGNVSWSCSQRPDFGEVHAYLQWRSPGQTTWYTKHHISEDNEWPSGSVTTSYLPCVPGYHRIFKRVSYRIGAQTGGESGAGPVIYLDCRP